MTEISQSTISRGTGQVNEIIDPRRFLPQNQPPPNQPPATRQVNAEAFIQQPVSRPLESEIAGTVNVDINSLLIPMPEGYSEPTPSRMITEMPTIPTPVMPVIQPVQPLPQPISINNSNDQSILIDIAKKLDKIIELMEKYDRQGNLEKKVQKSRRTGTV